MTTLRGITAGSFLVPAVLLICGCTTGGADVPEDSPLLIDPQECETAEDSPTDQACNADCIRNCGYDGTPHYSPERAKKYCVCQGGVYIECRCPKPDWYKGALFAPYCDKFTADLFPPEDPRHKRGWAEDLDDFACDKEWQECTGRDIVDGFTPRGAVCLDADGDGQFAWIAGSTEKWFAPEQ